MIEFSVDDWDYPAIGVAIICAPTGVLCTVQAGGLVCNHTKVEGFPIYVKANYQFFSPDPNFDCEWGCCGGEKDAEDGYDEEHIDNYGKLIDNFLSEKVNGKGNQNRFNFEFDPDRKKELMEGWWPVTIQFCSDWVDNEHYEKKFKGYLHFGNCD